jgi:hypothetical protein
LHTGKHDNDYIYSSLVEKHLQKEKKPVEKTKEKDVNFKYGCSYDKSRSKFGK